MFCEKCEKNISEDSVFCEFCGNETKKEQKIAKDSIKANEAPMKDTSSIQNEKLKQMANHLEFLGYQIEKLEATKEDKRETVFAGHPNNLNFTLLEAYPGFIILRALMSTKKPPSPEIDAFLNDINKSFVISKIYREIENNIIYLRIESIYTGDYIKELFGRFMDINIREHNQLRSLDNFIKLFVD